MKPANQDVKLFEVEIKGARLLMHNGRLADSMDPYTIALKQATEIKKKGFDDHVEVGRREFVGSLYFTKELGPVIPNAMLEACIIGAARRRKLGKEFEPSISVPEDFYRLTYSGPRDIDGLWAAREKFALRKVANVGGGEEDHAHAPALQGVGHQVPDHDAPLEHQFLDS